MRDIKFRAWNKGRDVMYCLSNSSGIRSIELSQYGEINTVELFEYLQNGDFVFVILNDDDVELLQYTGLLDKNGVEIYEGDIFSPDGIAVWVEYDEDQACFILKNEEWDKPFFKINSSGFEVIGNIYENQELLSEKDRAQWRQMTICY